MKQPAGVFARMVVLLGPLFAINNWNAGAKADIGNSPGQHRDWTLASNGEQYQSKRLRILVRPTGKPGKPKEPGWERSYASGKTDVNGQFLGGSEIFHIESHKGKLYAATSYWMDENNTYYSEGKRNQWAQVLVKDSKNSPWREDYDTGDDRGVLRPEVLQSVTFTKRTPDVNLLILATYRMDRTKYYVDIMVRNDATGKWIKTTPHSGPKVPDSHDFSVRAMRVYTDRVTREERIFVTVGIQGVLSGVYDPKAPGWIRWYPLHPVKFSERALSMCEANNSLVIGAGDAVWRRKDGPSPSYSIVHDLRDLVDKPVEPAIGGIRGMTTIDNPNGPGDSLLFLWSNADAKGACGSMYRLDPGNGGYSRHEDVRLAPVIQKEMNVHPTFILGSYSYVQPVRNPVTRRINHLIGLYVQMQHGEHSYPTWHPNKIYMGGLFAIRDSNGQYTVNEVNGRHNGSDNPLTAVRAIKPSPFRNDTDVYFGGHDCAFKMSTGFAWMYKAPLRTVLRLPPAKSREPTIAQTRTSPTDQAPAHRKWTSGDYSTEARLVTFADGIVVLEKSDGKTVSVAYAKLSPADQSFLDDWKERTSPTVQAPAHRKWTSGNYSTQARLVTFADGIAVLEKSDGKTVRVPYVVLSPTDGYLPGTKATASQYGNATRRLAFVAHQALASSTSMQATPIARFMPSMPSVAELHGHSRPRKSRTSHTSISRPPLKPTGESMSERQVATSTACTQRMVV